jgi:hypothetical protein
MPIGDIQINTLSIGDLDLTDPSIAQYVGFTMHEDIFDPHALPAAKIRVNDHSDALGKYNLTGKEKVKLAFSLENGDPIEFDLRCLQNKDLNDRSQFSQGALKSKQFDIRAVSPEYLNAQAHGTVQKSWEEPVSGMMKYYVKDILKSDKEFVCDDDTQGQIRHIGCSHPFEVYQQLNNRAVSQQNKSSAYVLFQSDNKYKYTTIEQLTKQSPVVVLQQSSTLGAGSSDEEKQNSIQSIKVHGSFYTTPRALTGTVENSYDPVTGKAVSPSKKPQNKFNVLGNQVVGETDWVERTPPNNRQVSYTQHDRANNKTTTNVASAKANRASYLAHLSQNYAEVNIPGNTKIKVGSVVEMGIPNKSTESNGNEKQFSGLVLVTGIKHIILPVGQGPRYQMILKVTKAGGYEEGGEG